MSPRIEKDQEDKEEGASMQGIPTFMWVGLG
jgi:hypothetical protein